MKISCQPVKLSPSFKSHNGDKNKYQNPVDMPMEYLTASIGPLVGGGVLGIGAGILTHYLSKEASKVEPKVANKKLTLIIGLVTGLATTLLTLIPKLYHASINGFVKTKEMDVFGRTKSVETNLAEQLDNQANNPEVSLKENIDEYFKFQMGKNGNGIVVAS